MDKYQTTIQTFDRVAQQYWDKFKEFKPYEPVYDWFLNHLKPEQNELLEIACGPGNVTHYLLNRRPDLTVFGIDLAPRMIELAKQHNPQAEFQIMDCRNINTLPKTYDAVMCGFCLPYLSWLDSLKLIKDIKNRLKPGGLMYLSTTKNEGSESGFKGSDSAAGAVFVQYHCIENIFSALNTANLKLLDSRTVIHSHNNEDTHDVFILASNPA